jgi:hypothetical protein
MIITSIKSCYELCSFTLLMTVVKFPKNATETNLYAHVMQTFWTIYNFLALFEDCIG